MSACCRGVVVHAIQGVVRARDSLTRRYRVRMGLVLPVRSARGLAIDIIDCSGGVVSVVSFGELV